MQTVDLQRIKLHITVALSVAGKSARAVSLEAGMGPDTLGKFLKGDTSSLRADNMASVLQVLNIPQDALTAPYNTDFSNSNNVKNPFGVRFGGVVEAGTFRPQNDLSQDDDYRMISLPHDTRFPHASQFAFSVMGDSMTRERIFEGMHVLAVEVAIWQRLQGQPRDGQLVIVARTRDGHPERELTVKKLRLFTDRMELQPCSDNPAYRPLVFPLPLQEADHTEAHIIAVVLSATWIYG